MIAVVTGGLSGLGLSFTKYLLSCGYKVYALYNKINNLTIEDKDLIKIKCNIKNEEEIINTLKKINNIDLLINNAGIAKDNDYQNKTKEEFMDVLETNLVGTFLMIKYSLDKLTYDGLIINISSNNALNAYTEISMDYDASKAGINILTKDFAKILKQKRIVSICPGWINTKSVLNANYKYIEEELKKNKQKKLIDKDKLAKYIIDNIEKYNNGDIIEIKEVE